MATWEDGPEYAPVERPAEFDGPDVAPLEVAPPPHRPAANAPTDRPRFDGPDVAVAPLSTLVPDNRDVQRDPNTPFDVAASTITSAESAWGAAHWSGPAAWGPPAGSPSGAGMPAPGTTGGGWPAADYPGADYPPAHYPAADYPGAGASSSPAGAPNWPAQAWPAPTDPMSLTSGPPSNAGGFAAPGTTQWFGYQQPMPQPTGSIDPTPGEVVKAMTPGVLITLLVTVVYPLAPVCFIVAFALCSRIRVARQQVIRAFTVTAVSIFVLTVIVFALSQNPDASFYTTLSVLTLLGSLVLVVIVAVLVRTALKKGAASPPPPGPGYPPYSGSPWG